MNNKNFAIGILSTTATMLLVGVALIHTRPETASADGMTASGGNYIVTVGSIDQIDEDLVYIIDTAAERMVAYRFDGNRQRVEIHQGLDLKKIREAGAAAPDPAKKPPPRRP